MYETKLANLHKTQNKLYNEYEYYSEIGYLNTCADIDNLQHYNTPSNTNKETIKAIQQFIPCCSTPLQTLQNKYRQHKFAQQYSAISFQPIFQKLNIIEFDVPPGELFDAKRMKIVSREYSTQFRENEVIRTETCGLKVNDFVLDFAGCVVSLGPDKDVRVKNAFGRRFN